MSEKELLEEIIKLRERMAVLESQPKPAPITINPVYPQPVHIWPTQPTSPYFGDPNYPYWPVITCGAANSTSTDLGEYGKDWVMY